MALLELLFCSKCRSIRWPLIACNVQEKRRKVHETWPPLLTKTVSALRHLFMFFFKPCSFCDVGARVWWDYAENSGSSQHWTRSSSWALPRSSSLALPRSSLWALLQSFQVKERVDELVLRWQAYDEMSLVAEMLVVANSLSGWEACSEYAKLVSRARVKKTGFNAATEFVVLENNIPRSSLAEMEIFGSRRDLCRDCLELCRDKVLSFARIKSSALTDGELVTRWRACDQIAFVAEIKSRALTRRSRIDWPAEIVPKPDGDCRQDKPRV